MAKVERLKVICQFVLFLVGAAKFDHFLPDHIRQH
jgi:hypothetical protein